MTGGEAFDQYDFDKFDNYVYESEYGAAVEVKKEEKFPFDEEPEDGPVIKQFRPVGRAQTRRLESLDRKRILFVIIMLIPFSLLFFFQLSMGAKSYELDCAISETNRDIEEARSKNDTLSARLAEKTNIVKVDDYAENVLGMVKRENYQVVYVNLSDDSRIIFDGAGAEE